MGSAQLTARKDAVFFQIKGDIPISKKGAAVSVRQETSHIRAY